MTIVRKALVVIAVFGVAFVLGRAAGELIGRSGRNADAVTPTASAAPILRGDTVRGEELPPPLNDFSLPIAPPQSAGDTIRRRVVDFEAALRTGELAAVTDYGDGNGTALQMRFDFGDTQQLPQLYLTTVYTSAGQTQVSERITVGEQSWQRQDGGDWAISREPTSVREQVQRFLPRVADVENPEIISDSDVAVLHWYDKPRDADMTLLADLESGAPRQMRQVTRPTDLALIITYSAWNTPVRIEPPVMTR
jgi:ketosteroid isomerase-like protein